MQICNDTIRQHRQSCQIRKQNDVIHKTKKNMSFTDKNKELTSQISGQEP